MLEIGATSQRNKRRLLRPGWPLFVVFVGFPLWWILGMGGFIWPLVAFLMLLSLLRRDRVTVPKGFVIWLGFILWMLATATQLDSFSRTIGFAYRASIYTSVTIFFVYLYNASTAVLQTRAVVALMAIFWTFVVVGGILGIAFPSVSFASPVEHLLPQSIVANDFVKLMVHPSFAEIQTVLGYPLPRPAAPFVYTNDWGGNYALLFPFVVLVWSGAYSKRFKTVLAAFAAVSVIPVAVSLNRGLWVSLGLGLIYAAVRFALRGRERPLIGIMAVLAVVAAAVLFTPLHQIIDERLASPHSNNRRVSLYEEAVGGAIQSPLFGWGAPRPSTWNPNAPSVGTQGQFWLVLFSNGFPGATLFMGWFIYAFWKLRRSNNPVVFWCHVMLLIMLVQLIVYDFIPTQLHVVMVGVALAMRELKGPDQVQVLVRPGAPLRAARSGVSA